MDKTNIELWFNKGFVSGVEVQILQHSNVFIDGKHVWNEIETKLTYLKDVDLIDDADKIIKYNFELEEIYKQMDLIINEFKMDLFEYEPLSNHFFIQLKNIPNAKSNFNVRINRIVQLGFNAGQLSVFIEKNTLPEDRRKIISDFIEKYKLFDINTYISSKIQHMIDTKYLDNTEFDLKILSCD